MSLRVWLPLNGDLRNQGSSDIEVTNNGATVNSAGKIGSCYYFNGTSTNYMTTTYSTAIGTNDFSIAMWIKIPTLTSGSYYAICTSKTTAAAGAGFGIYWNYTQKKFLWSTADGSASTEIWMANTVDTIVYDKWIHLVMVRNNNDSKKGYFYINGTRYELASVPAIRNITTDTKMNLGRCTNNSYFAKMYVNDFRIYDHALSIAEVREIAQGLVLHYKLNNYHSNNINLITNGYGDQGTLNWTSTSGVSTDVPSGHSEIKKSFSNNTTVDYIPINIQDQYQFEIYIKGTASSGTVYPSFLPYDADKNFIYHAQCKDGFNLNTMTTITQTLNPGDTQIHVASLANWNINSGHYYNYAAIFKYRDNSGFLYGDGEYTRNTPAFGTGTNAKTNLDKTNNIITLNSAYTGPQISVGTSVCAAADGSTYYYPFGGIAQTSITNWTYKSVTLVPKEKNRLKYARYIKFYTYSNNLTAGIKLTNLTLTNGLIDSSGYNYNGTITGTLQVLSDTAHYNNSTYFNGSSYSKISSPTSEIQTISLWAKWSSIPSGQSIIYVDYKSKTGLGLMSTGILCSACGLSSYTFSKANIVANTWYHFVIVCPNGASSSTRKLYINGVEQTATSNTSNWTHSIDELQLGKRSTTSDGFTGEISDFRMYCTQLLDNDIKVLYNTTMRIDPHKNIHNFELNENAPYNKLTPTGMLEDNMVESYLTLSDGSKWKLMLFHYVDGGTNLFTSSNATYCNEWGLYSRLSQITNYQYDGKYEYYVIQDGTEFRWTQTSSPTASSISGLTTVSGYTNPVNGLAKASQNNTYIGYGSWWGACGCWTSYSTGGKTGIPGFGPHGADGICTKYLILYTRVSDFGGTFEDGTAFSNNFIEM